MWTVFEKHDIEHETLDLDAEEAHNEDAVDDDDCEIDEGSNDNNIFGKHDLGRKQISAASFAFLVEEEIRIRKEAYGFEKPLNKSYEKYMEHVDHLRVNEIYPHECHPHQFSFELFVTMTPISANCAPG